MRETSMPTHLSGLQPTGLPHLGNYFGAIQNHIALGRSKGWEDFYFIADYHALTTSRDAGRAARSRCARRR